MEARTSFLSSVGVLSAARIISMIMNFIAVSHMAHALGAANFGALMFAAAYAEYFTLVANIGLDNYLPQAVAARRKLSHRLAGTSIGLRLVLAAVMFPLVGASLLFIPIDAETKPIVLIIAASMFASAIGMSAIYGGLQWMRMVAARDCIWALMNMLTALVLVHSPDDLVRAAVGTVVSTTLANCIVFTLYVRHFGWPRIRINWRPYVTLARRSVPFLFVLLLWSLIATFKLVVLGFTTSEAQVGLFSAAWRLFTLVVIPVHLLATVFLPRLSEQRDPAERAKVAELFFRLIILSVLPVAGIGIVLAEHLLHFFFGAEFVAASSICALLIASSLAFAFTTTQTTILVAVGQRAAYVRVYLVGAGASVAMDLLLIPLLGASGAAISALLTQIGMAAASLFYLRLPLASSAAAQFFVRCLLSVGGAVVAGILLLQMLPLTAFAVVPLAIGSIAIAGTYSLLLYLAGLNPRSFAQRVRSMG